MDGVLWRGSQPLPGLTEFFEFLRAREIRFVLATNNSTRTEAEYADRLTSYGAPVSVEEIVASSSATAEYLTTILPPGSPVYAIGLRSVREALTRQGFELSQDRGVLAVVVGMDWNVDYEQLRRATLLIRGGAKFIGTNPDATYPAPEGIIPGNGAILAAIETATGVKPIIVGKPEPILYQQAMRRLTLPRTQMAALGDRMETDILGGIRAGIKTILVLSGVTTAEQLALSSLRPDWVFRDIVDLMQHWHVQ